MLRVLSQRPSIAVSTLADFTPSPNTRMLTHHSQSQGSSCVSRDKAHARAEPCSWSPGVQMSDAQRLCQRLFWAQEFSRLHFTPPPPENKLFRSGVVKSMSGGIVKSCWAGRGASKKEICLPPPLENAVRGFKNC